MSKHPHTPGPWEVDDVCPTRVNYSGTGDEICDTRYATELTRAAHEANARLIAAAPDLLDAVKRCAGVLAGDMTKNGLIDALEKARAAIAKAKGETA